MEPAGFIVPIKCRPLPLTVPPPRASRTEKKVGRCRCCSIHPIIESAIHASFWPIVHHGPVRTTYEPFRNPSRSPSPWPASMAGWTNNIISCNEVEWRALVAPPRRSHTMGCSGGRSGNAVRWYNNGGRGGGDGG